MPDGMIIGQPFPRIENHSEGVEETADRHPDQTSMRDAKPQLPASNNNKPSHQKIANNRQFAKPNPEYDLEHYPYYCQPPNNAKQRYPPSSTKSHPEKRRVSSRD